MRVLVDSSSVINLFNAEVLHLFCALDRCEFYVPPLVVGECDEPCAAELVTLREAGCLKFVDDTDVDGDYYLELLEAHGLGAGETECITIAALADEYSICCDDKKARATADDVIGADRVIGTLRLLRWCVEDALIDCGQAFGTFNVMKDKGGFLPETPQSFFCDVDCYD